MKNYSKTFKIFKKKYKHKQKIVNNCCCTYGLHWYYDGEIVRPGLTAYPHIGWFNLYGPGFQSRSYTREGNSQGLGDGAVVQALKFSSWCVPDEIMKFKREKIQQFILKIVRCRETMLLAKKKKDRNLLIQDGYEITRQSALPRGILRRSGAGNASNILQVFYIKNGILTTDRREHI